MFTLTRRAATIAAIAAAAVGPGLLAGPAGAHPAGPTTLAAAGSDQQMALLLPAVQAARESAR